MLKTFLELSQKRTNWEAINHQLLLKDKIGVIPSDYLLSSYASEKLTDDEEGELYEAECELDERIIGLKSKELSIEQWSFIKTLYPEMDETSFIEIIASLSKEFIGQLSIRQYDTDN